MGSLGRLRPGRPAQGRGPTCGRVAAHTWRKARRGHVAGQRRGWNARPRPPRAFTARRRGNRGVAAAACGVAGGAEHSAPPRPSWQDRADRAAASRRRRRRSPLPAAAQLAPRPCAQRRARNSPFTGSSRGRPRPRPVRTVVNSKFTASASASDVKTCDVRGSLN